MCEEMNLQKKKEIIQTYFQMWVTRDFNKIYDVFSDDVYYSECYGPEYRGMGQIQRWITYMLQRQVVSKWDIKNFIFSKAGDDAVVEWTFSAKEETAYTFDGVSLIHFNKNGQIDSIKEFKSEAKRFTPDFVLK